MIYTINSFKYFYINKNTEKADKLVIYNIQLILFYILTRTEQADKACHIHYSA